MRHTGEGSPPEKIPGSLLADSLRWSRDEVPEASQVVVAMVGLTGPIALGAVTGHLQFGMAAAMGALALSGGGQRETAQQQASSMAHALVAGSAAMVIGAAMARQSLPESFAIVAVVALAALLGCISRPLGRATAVFILFATIALGLGQQGIRPRGAMLLFALGAVWTIALSLLMRALLRVRHRTSVQAAASPRPSASKLLMRWRRSLAHLPGWQYTLRITSCMAAALALERMWPEHHSYWVALTVAIVVTRKMPAALLRTVQRAVGTIVGVLLAGLLLIWALPVWAIIAVVAALAAARPILRAANYAAYAAIMTPLIMLLMDLGARPSPGVFLDRLIATVIGCAIAVTLGYLVWVRLLVPAPDVRQSKAPGNGSAGK